MPVQDLSQPLRDGDRSYPGDPSVELSPHAAHEEDGYRVTRVGLGSHSGTHVDAPAHLFPDGRTLDAYPVETFRFDARVVRLSGLAPREPIPAGRLSETDADLVALEMGWDRHWGDDAYFDHPYLTERAAEWLADRAMHVAVDAPNVDPTPTDRAREDEPDDFPAHRELLGADRLIVENLTGLGDVPDRFTLHAYPLALPDADGAPVRAVAEFSKDDATPRQSDPVEE